VTQFQFISFQETSDKNTKRLARSHAVKQALQSKRKEQKASMQHFCIRTIEDEKKPKRGQRRGKPGGTLTPSPISLSATVLDPFQTLAVDTKRLQALLNNGEFSSKTDNTVR
jgi:hypothetical protein